MYKYQNNQRLPFHYLKSMTTEELLDFLKGSCNTFHFHENQLRNTCLREDAKPIEHFIAVIDKEHKNGPEVHALYDDGSIRIYNYKSHRFITVLMARPGQAKRIMDKKCYKTIPQNILNMCLSNQNKGRNYL